jgi:hypothetical protein
MPRIIDYPDVRAMLTLRGLTSIYYNSGSFGFARDEQFCGWRACADKA